VLFVRTTRQICMATEATAKFGSVALEICRGKEYEFKKMSAHSAALGWIILSSVWVWGVGGGLTLSNLNLKRSLFVMSSFRNLSSSDMFRMIRFRMGGQSGFSAACLVKRTISVRENVSHASMMPLKLSTKIWIVSMTLLNVRVLLRSRSSSNTLRICLIWMTVICETLYEV
jgi:hypothetical protein